MRIHRLFYIMWVASVVSLSSCVKDDLYNTPHPDKGAVEVTTDWTGRSSDAVVPADYILRIGGEEQMVQGETNAFKSLFLPGTQSLLAYHQTEGVTISGTTATVNTLGDGTLNPMPGFLFSASKELDIQKDDTLKVVVPMMQRIRTLALTLKLNPGDERRIASTASTLTGIAPSMDLATGSDGNGRKVGCPRIYHGIGWWRNPHGNTARRNPCHGKSGISHFLASAGCDAGRKAGTDPCRDPDQRHGADRRHRPYRIPEELRR